MDRELALRRDRSEEFQDVPVGDPPQRLGQLPAAERVGLGEEDLIDPGLLEGVDHPVGVADQVEVAGACEGLFGPPERRRVPGVGRRLVHQQAGGDPRLEAAVGFAGRAPLGGEPVDDRPGLLRAAAAHLHHRPQQPLQPEGVAPREGVPPLVEGVEVEQLELRRREQVRVAPQHHAQQRRARPRRRKHEERRRVPRRRRRLRGEGADPPADLLDGLRGERGSPLPGPSRLRGLARRPAPDAGCGHPVLAGQEGREIGEDRRVEQRDDMDDLAEEGLEVVDEDRAGDRVAAEVEEAVAAADPLHREAPQRRAPELRQTPLQSRPRRLVGGGGGRLVERRQRLAVHLAVGAERQRLQQHEAGGDHILGERGRERRPQLLHQHGRGGNDVGHQPPVPHRARGGRPARHHHRLAHRVEGGQRRLDLPQLDAEAADLHLVVEAPQELDGAVGQESGEVAGAVGPRAGQPEWIGHEALRRQLRAAEVPPAHLHAADNELAGRTDRHRFPLPIDDVQAGVGHRPADRHRAPPAVALTRPPAHVHRRLGGTIEVVQRHVEPLKETLHQIGRQRLAAAQHPPQRAAAGHPPRPQEHLQHRGDEVEGGDPLTADLLDQVGRILMAARRRHHQPRARHQRPEELPDRDVEAERRLLEHPVGGVEAEGLLHPEQAVDDAAVGVHRSLRPTGRAGGEDRVGQAVRIDLDRGALRLPSVQSQRHHPCAVLRQPRDQVDQRRLDEQHGSLRRRHHIGEAVGRVGGVERHVGAPRLEHRQQGDDHLQRALGADPDRHLRTDPQLPQPPRQGVSPPVELAIGQRKVPRDHSDALRGAVDLRLDQPVEQEGGWIGHRRRRPLAELLRLARAQQGQRGDRPRLVGHRPGEQALEVPRQPLDRGGVE